MRIIALVTTLAILAIALPRSVAQQSAGPTPGAAATAGTAGTAGANDVQSTVSLFQPGSLSAAFSEEPADPAWAPATEARIAAEIEKQQWPGLTRAEVECRRSICVLLLVYSAGGDVEAKLKDSLRKGLGFAGIRSARKALPGSTVSEVLFVR